jgi:prepilin-type N-terminal cleavage/methylation domain-containing protein
MNNMRRGFTMIELIFVIVIIGILAAVAIPKLGSVSSQAKIAKIVAYAGTLNRTTLPPYWSKSITAGQEGAVDSYSADILTDLTPPSDLGDVGFSNSDKYDSTGDFKGDTAGTAMASIKLDDVTYTLVCTNGTPTESPKCDVFNAESKKYMLYTSR